MAQNDKKKELAMTLYMSGKKQCDIAIQVGVTAATVTKWAKEGRWAEKRAAKTVTRPELINRILLQIDKLLENAQENDDFTKLGDQLSKAAAAIEKLDKKSNSVDIINVCTMFGKFVETQIGKHKEVTVSTAKILNALQDAFINAELSKGDKL